jgi:glutamate/tyrosine decarboxylase-like PLP-dependent enzyme
MGEGRLELSSDEMRAFGYRVIDLIVEHFDTLPDQPIGRKGARSALEAALREPIPETPASPDSVLDRLERDVFSNMLHVDHPRFFSFVPGPGNFASAMADALIGGLNVFTGTWFAGSGPAQIELVAVDWLRGICGLPETAGGLFVSGGSMANLTALAVARHARLGERIGEATVYASDQTHSSVLRALRVLGFMDAQVRILACDEEFRLPVAALRAALAEDRAAGLVPFCVVANAGTTNSGAVDPLPALADLCAAEAMWLHADGAYGAPAVLTEAGKTALVGMDRVDSLALDPHKWLFQSFESGCVLVRDRALLLETFQVMPEYLRDTQRGAEEVNFGNYGLQLTRSFRALKLWMSLQIFGLAEFRAAIGRGIALAELAERELGRDPAWQIVTAASLAVVTFRYAPPGMAPADVDALQGQMVEAMIEEGYALATSTMLKGRAALRLCTINPRTRDAEMIETVRRLGAIGARLSGA